ncbi:MAG: carboxyl transferase domain-containing protein, partial [Pseudonocardiaceae bacterium]
MLAATGVIDSLDAATAFITGLGPDSPVMVKALSGGGGRGMRMVHRPDDLAEAIERCRSEALSAFGSADIFIEQLLSRARHVEVQVLGDGSGDVVVLGDRDCSLQRQRQKLIEIAPAPGLSDGTRKALAEAATAMASHVAYRGLATFEFLLDADSGTAEPDFSFMEANPRLQVEHTVTEEISGIDLVKAQLRVAAGTRIDHLDLDPVRTPRGFAVQARINAESISADGAAIPQAGTVSAYEPPGGPGVRVDGSGYVGYRVSARYDSLIAKLVVRDRSPALGDAMRRLQRALAEFRIDGVATNRDLLRELLARQEVRSGRLHTRLVDDVLLEVLPATADPAPPPDDPAPGAGVVAVSAAMPATVVEVGCSPGDTVAAGATLLVLEAMKMEHLVTASVSGTVRRVLVRSGELVAADQSLILLTPGDVEATYAAEQKHLDLDQPRADLAALIERRAYTADAARADAVTRRHAAGRRTARENIADLCDDGSFVEYGALAIAAQRRRRPVQDLVERTPADGLVAGVGTVNAARFGHERARTIALSYDYLVLAGTQGHYGHAKKDRMFALAEQARLPVVLFAEGGGGRPGDTDGGEVTGLDCMAFALYARLSGIVPLVGIASGRCFAGNAALLGCSDVIIATPEASIGMGGPAMIEGGGLGVFPPEAVGPSEVQRANGVIDLMAADDADAVALAQRYLSYFQGALDTWAEPDQRELR